MAAPTIAAIVVAGTLAASSAAAQTLSRHTRCVGRSEAPVAQALRPEDEIVVIEEWAILDTLAGVSKTPRRELRRLKDIADAVALIDVNAVASSLVPDHSWITTKVAGSLREVFKEVGMLNRDPNGQVEVSVDGGRVQVGSVDVRTWQSLELEPATQYLFFFKRPGEGSSTAGWWPFAVHRVSEDGTLRKSWNADPCRIRPRDTASTIEGISLEMARRELRKK
jgi:hypothetical protein